MKWEYWVQSLVLPSGVQALQKALDDASDAGWELVSVTQDGDGSAYMLFWKRPRDR